MYQEIIQRTHKLEGFAYWFAALFSWMNTTDRPNSKLGNSFGKFMLTAIQGTVEVVVYSHDPPAEDTGDYSNETVSTRPVEDEGIFRDRCRRGTDT
jgi:hypothetical protein